MENLTAFMAVLYRTAAAIIQQDSSSFQMHSQSTGATLWRYSEPFLIGHGRMIVCPSAGSISATENQGFQSLTFKRFEQLQVGVLGGNAAG